MTTSSARTAHTARKQASKIGKTLAQPHGNYDHSEFMFGQVASISTGPPPTVEIYPNGSQHLANQPTIPSVKYMAWYAPTVGDVVLIYRGHRRNRSSRIVLGKVNGSASPYPIPLGGFDSDGRYVTGLLSLWGATGAPAADLGAAGDWCLSQNGHLYFNDDSTWTEKV